MVDELPSFAERASRFQFRRRVGEGAFGVVWEVYDQKREARVALKSLVRTDPAALLRFKREFRALSDLVHPNLVTLYELLSFDDVWFFTMEFVDGVDFIRYVTGRTDPWAQTAGSVPGATVNLDEPEMPAPTFRSEDLIPSSQRRSSTSRALWQEALTKSSEVVSSIAVEIKRNMLVEGPGFNPERVRAATQKLAVGLSALHDARKLHRDIKPSNVLVTAEGRVVILDFGLITDLPPEGFTEGSRAVVGTPGFMSPEQALGKALSPATDWYSVGVMLYVAMTGRMPFDGGPLQLLLNQQQRDPTPPHELARGIPVDLERLCLDLLKREPEARPTAGEIVARLGGIPDAVRMSIPPSTLRRTPFVGREALLAALHEAYAVSERGRAAAALVYGASGLGKSTLVRRFIADLRAKKPEAVILSGRCYEREAVPYKALDNLIDDLSVYLRRLDPDDAAALMPRGVESLARLFPVLRQVEGVASPLQPIAPIADPRELRLRAFGALRDLLARLAGTRPLVLVIDDLQWGDADSDALLAEIVRAPTPPLLLVATYRAEDISKSPLKLALSSASAGESGVKVRELEVTEFTPAEAEELATALLDFTHVRRARAIAQEAGYNPLFIEALVQHLEWTSSELSRDADASSVRSNRDARPVPSSGVPLSIPRLPAPPLLPGDGEATKGIPVRIDLAEMLRARVARIPQGARLLLEAVVVAGRPIDLSVATRAAGIQSFDPSMLSILVASRLAKSRPLPGGAIQVEAFHDRIREPVLTAIPPAELRLYHATLAVALEEADEADPEVLAAHYEAAGEHERSSAYALKAAAEAFDALAFDRAARLYEAAIRRAPVPDRALQIRLGEALANAGRGAKAADAFLAAARGTTGRELIHLRRRAAEQLLISGHVDRGLELCRKVLLSLGMSLPTSTQGAVASLVYRRAQLWARGLLFEEREATADELLRIDACWAVAVGLGLVDSMRGADFQARHLLLALKAGEPYRVARALAVEVSYTAIGGTKTWAKTEEMINRAAVLAERIGDPHAIGLATTARATAHLLRGDFAKALEYADKGALLLRERCVGVTWEIDTAQIFVLSSLCSMGRWREMIGRMEEVLRSADARGDLYASTNIILEVGWCAELAQDEPEQARRILEEITREESRRVYGTQDLNYMIAFGNIHLYMGEARAAHTLVESSWGGLRRSLTFEIQAALVSALDLRARAAIGWAMAPDTTKKKRRELLKAASMDIEKLEAEQVPSGTAIARLRRSSLALAEGARAAARAHAIAAEEALRRVDMEVHSAAALMRAGQLTAGAEGAAMVASAELRLVAQGIKNPARVVDMVAPGRFF